MVTMDFRKRQTIAASPAEPGDLPHGLDELSEQYRDGGEEHKSAVVGEEFVISRGDAPELLQFVEETLDEIALFVERLVVGERRAAVGFWRNDRLRGAFEDSLAQVIGVITLVGDDGVGLKAFDQVVRLGDVVSLAWPEQQADRVAERVGRGVDFGA